MILDRGERGWTGAKRPGGARFVEADPEFVELLEEQKARFREKFGRDPGPDDPLLFDPDADEPRPVSQEKMEDEFRPAMIEAMRGAGVDPALIYAYDKTEGMMPVAGKEHLWALQELDEWNTYADEYFRVSTWVDEMRSDPDAGGLDESDLESCDELYAFDHVENDDDLNRALEDRSREYFDYAEEFKRVVAWRKRQRPS